MTLRLSKTLLLRLALVAGVGMLVGTAAQEGWAANPSEYEVKAAYLYNFGRFVEWPPDSSSHQISQFSICVLGHDPFGAVLDTTISGEKIDGKHVVARRIAKVEEAGDCRILFIGPYENKQLKEFLASVGKLNVLTVSDLPDFLEQGGMVQFILTNNRVRFAINLAAAQQAGLKLSSELLKVAIEVRGKSRPGD